MNKVDPNYQPETRRLLPEVSDAELDAAKAYEEIFVPALFQCWPPHIISAASVGSGDRTLDIACGTGVVARQLLIATGNPSGTVGLDIAPGMLEVANQLNPEINWRLGDAVSLPFENHCFDRVLCQFGLMFFPDRIKALKEMSRVLAPGGRIALAVWDGLEKNPGFTEKVEILDRVAGRDAGDALRAPFCLGDTGVLRQLATDAGLCDIQIDTIPGEARFQNIRSFVNAEVYGWLPVMGVHLKQEVIDRIYLECEQALAPHESMPEGNLVLPMSAHIVSAEPG